MYTIYNMPIWLRKFTFSEIQKYHDEERKSYEKAQKGSSQNTTLVNSEGKVNTPAFLQANQQYKGKASYKP